MLKRKTIAILFPCSLIALAPLICYAQTHFAVDSYGLAYHYDVHSASFLGAYRYVGALLIRLWTLFFDPIRNPTADVIVFLVVAALSVAALSATIIKILELKSFLGYIVAVASVLISVINVWAVNILTFPECIVLYAFGIMFCFFAVICYFYEKIGKWRFPLSGLLLICSIAIYQQFVSIFMIYTLLLIGAELMLSKEKSAKKALERYLSLLAFLLVCFIVYFAVGYVLRQGAGLGANPRAEFSFAGFVESLKYYVSHQRYLLRGKNFFNSNILRRCYEILGLIWIVAVVCGLFKNGFSVKTLIVLLTFPAAYAAAYLPGLISTHDGVRVVMGLFSVFALFAIGSLAFYRRRWIALCLALLLVFVYGLNIRRDIVMLTEQLSVNADEIALTQKYLDEIKRYEQSGGVEVKTVVFCCDGHIDYLTEKPTGIILMYTLETDWGLAGLLEYVSRGERGFAVIMKTPQELSDLFGETDFSEYDPAAQLRFEGDTLYLCIY